MQDKDSAFRKPVAINKFEGGPREWEATGMDGEVYPQSAYLPDVPVRNVIAVPGEPPKPARAPRRSVRSKDETK